MLTEDVEHVDLGNRPFTIRTSDTEVGNLAHQYVVAERGAHAQYLQG